MSLLDIYGGMTKVDLLLPVSKTSGTSQTTSVDVSQFEGKGFIVLGALNTAGTTPALNVKQQGSDASGTGQADVSGGAFDPITDATAAISVIPVDFGNTKKWLNLYVAVTGGSSPAFTTSAALFGKKKSQ